MPRLGEISPGRAVHILDGDGDGIRGGHRWDSEIPGKTKFPRSWNDDKILDMIGDVARRPNWPPERQDNGRWQCEGSREGVKLIAIVNPDGSVWTGFPERGPGVVRNPK